MITIIIVISTVVFIIIRYRLQIDQSYQYAGQATATLRSKLLPVPQYYKDLLEKYFRYYQGLSEENKRVFEQKLCRFIYSKRFIPRGMKEVPPEMVVFVAAVAVQITFGLPQVYLQHFNKIIIYPDDYYSNITKRYHRGEVNPAFGIIVLSWSHFMDGFINTRDTVNLGLHEMAHALRLENIIHNEEYEFFNESLLKQLDDWCRRICSSNESLQATFFRPYACTNVHEFFSVAIENFFERSVQFKSELPELYNILVRLLNQDPIKLSVHPQT
jgi:Mlc titration factor MtfA (ptsG expression regulator)